MNSFTRVIIQSFNLIVLTNDTLCAQTSFNHRLSLIVSKVSPELIKYKLNILV